MFRLDMKNVKLPGEISYFMPIQSFRKGVRFQEGFYDLSFGGGGGESRKD